MENKDNYPLVSIGIPTYNGSLRIPKTLESILAQRYPNLEIIISDNCSTDGMQAYCEEFARHHPEVKYFRQKENIGILPNFEFTINTAQGKYFMWVADDDTLGDNVLVRYVDFFEKHPDYNLVSGAIQYWDEDKPSIVEKDFTITYNNPSLRVLKYYNKVLWGAMFHGLHRRSTVQKVPTRRVMGNDFHFVANVAYQGKMKNFDFIGYNKKFGGSSRDLKKYAKVLGESDFVANFPFFKIATDAYREVMYLSPIFAEMNPVSRFLLAVGSFSSSFLGYYGVIYPRIIGGKVKRFFIGQPRPTMNQSA